MSSNGEIIDNHYPTPCNQCCEMVSLHMKACEWCKVLVCNECQKEYQGQTICVDCYEHHTGRAKYK